MWDGLGYSPCEWLSPLALSAQSTCFCIHLHLLMLSAAHMHLHLSKKSY